MIATVEQAETGSAAPGAWPAAAALPLPQVAGRRPADVAESFRDLPGLALLESARIGGAARWSWLVADPVARLQGPSPGSDPFSGARAQLARLATEAGSGGAEAPPFRGGLVGYLGYGLREALEPRLAGPGSGPRSALPDLWLGLYDWAIGWDRRTGRAWLAGCAVDGDWQRLRRRLGEVLERLTSAPDDAQGEPAPPLGHPGRLEFVSNLSRSAYEAAVERTRAAIAAGEIYQANVARRLSTPFTGDPWPLYRRLRDGDPALNAAFLDLGLDLDRPEAGAGAATRADAPAAPVRPSGSAGPRAIVSASPEGFLSIDARGLVTTRPIKGTRPRGRDRAEDRRLAAELLASAKDRAENVMIVDVLRNDLGRVCRPGSVRVPRLCRLERTDAVQHLVSTVTGRLRPDADPFDLLAAAFPGGSITGAPRIRAMELIAELEPVARGPYTGALGWIGPDGAMSTSILIRTFVADGRTLSLHVGGGITWRSDPSAEWEETVAKAGGPLRAIGGHEIDPTRAVGA